MTDPRIRPARPEDVEAAVPLIYSSGPEAFDFVFSHRSRVDAHGFIAHGFASGWGEFSWRYHRVVEVGGEVVGTAVGYTGAEARHFMWPAIAHIFRCYGPAGGARVILRGLQIERVVVPPRRADLFYIGNLAIAPHLRGRGLGQRLLEHMHHEARSRGARLTALDVSVENPRAEALYARLGYEVVGEMPSTLRNAAGYVPPHRRMEFGPLTDER